MKAAVHRFARRLWAGELGRLGRLLSVALLPASGLWRVVTGWRNRRHDANAPVEVEGLRVVSIGNLAVGGTGKTPLASWAARVLTGEGARVAILRRAYGRDETLLHRASTADVPVLEADDRVAGAMRARAAGADVVVLDDGFQHRRLGRSVDLVLLAVEDRFPGPVLPRGPYREPAARLARADVVVLTRRQATVEAAMRLADAVRATPDVAEDLVRACVHLTPGRLRPLGAARETSTLEADTALPTLESPLVMTAVARPEAVLRDVASICRGTAELLAFPDHHEYDARDVRRALVRAGGRPLVVTEKDAVKLEAWPELSHNCWVLSQELVWDWGYDDVLGLVAGVASGATR